MSKSKWTTLFKWSLILCRHSCLCHLFYTLPPAWRAFDSSPYVGVINWCYSYAQVVIALKCVILCNIFVDYNVTCKTTHMEFCTRFWPLTTNKMQQASSNSPQPTWGFDSFLVSHLLQQPFDMTTKVLMIGAFVSLAMNVLLQISNK